MSAVSTPICSPHIARSEYGFAGSSSLYAHRSAHVSLVDERGEYANPLPHIARSECGFAGSSSCTRIGRRAFPRSMSAVSTPICSPTSLAASTDSPVHPLCTRIGRRAFPWSMSAVSTPIRSPATGAAVWIRWFILLRAHRSARVFPVDEHGVLPAPPPQLRRASQSLIAARNSSA